MSCGGEDGRDVARIMGNLWQVLSQVLDGSAPALEALGLSSKAFFLLQAVGDFPFPAELARRMHLQPPTVTYLVKQLEAKGFLGRRAEPGDLRKFRLVRTPEGDRAVVAGQESLARVLGERLGRLGPDEVAALDRIVGRLAARSDDGA